MRSYGQYCSVAKALDVIGDRWTLLIIRELLLQGPCRYTDLKNGLPGIATNLLADRLDQLATAGLVRREEAPPPVATTLFHLTEGGAELKPVLDALGLPSSGYDVVAGVQPAKMIQALRELLGWLARPAPEQRSYLDQPFAPPVQDLPLTLDDCVTVFVPRLTAAGAISPAAATAVAAVRDFIRAPAVQADPALCDQAALATSETWATLRDLARTALDALA